MKYSFGNRSSDNLLKLNEPMQRVVHRALSFGVMDISVICTLRDDNEQIQLYKDGKSEKDGIKKRSKHQENEDGQSCAVDLMPYPPNLNGVNVWTDKIRWHILAGLMYAAASLEGVSIIWGGDWDGDGNNADSNFNDLPHFEEN